MFRSTRKVLRKSARRPKRCRRCGRTVHSREKDWEDPPARAPKRVQKVHLKAVETAYDIYGHGEEFDFDSEPVRTRESRLDEWLISSPYSTSHMRLIYDEDKDQWYYKGKSDRRQPLKGGYLEALHWVERLFRY